MIRFRDIEYLTTNEFRLEGAVDILLTVEVKPEFLDFEEDDFGDSEAVISVWVEEGDLENAFILMSDVYGGDETPINMEEREAVIQFIIEEGLLK